MLLMGFAGGAGIGRLLLAPLEEAFGSTLVVLSVVIVIGLALGLTMVTVRRRQSARTHLQAVLTEQIAGLRADVEHHIGGRVLAAEADVTDGFAQSPGPRVDDLDRRIRRLRGTGRSLHSTDQPQRGTSRPLPGALPNGGGATAPDARSKK